MQANESPALIRAMIGLVACCLAAGCGRHAAVSDQRPASANQATVEAAAGSPGDGGALSSPAATEGSAGEEQPPAQFAAEPLTIEVLGKLGDYLPVLDDGRIELAPPEHWKPLPRAKDYVARFGPIKPAQVPRIHVTALELPGEVAQAGDMLPGWLALVVGEWSAEKLWTKRPTIARLSGGGRVVILYGVPATIGGVAVERVFVEAIEGGRRYQFELQAYPDVLAEARQALLATVAGLRAGSPKSE